MRGKGAGVFMHQLRQAWWAPATKFLGGELQLFAVKAIGLSVEE